MAARGAGDAEPPGEGPHSPSAPTPSHPPPQSSIRVRLLASQVAAHLATGNLSREALAKAAGGALTPRDVAACLAALRAVLAGSARHSVEAGVLAREMEQLGLPRGAAKI